MTYDKKSNRDEIYKRIVNKIVEASEKFQPKITKEYMPDSIEMGEPVCEISLPYEKKAPVNSEFFVSTMPYFSRRLALFTERSQRNIKLYRKNYESRRKTSSSDNARLLQEFLQVLCRDVNEVFFQWGGVRTHFRYLHTDKKQYLKLAVAMPDGDYDFDYAMSEMPSEGVSMISKAAELKTPLIYSINPGWHQGENPATRPFKDYVTFVLLDNAFTHRGKYLLSMGISFAKPDVHRNLYYLLALSRFDEIISYVVRSFVDALNINVENTILENSDLIEQGFHPKNDELTT